MSDVSKEDSGGDTTLELSKDDGQDDKGIPKTNGSDDPDESSILCSDYEDIQKSSKSSRANVKDATDPVKVLQLSQNFFVSDTMEDDDDVSLIIPPTPSEDTAPFMIPSTPMEKNDGEQETSTLLGSKEAGLEKQQLLFDDDDDDDEWTKPTQPLYGIKRQVELSDNEPSDEDETFADTEALLGDFNAPTQPNFATSEEREAKHKKEDDEQEDDEWNLRLTATQATQPVEELPIEIPFASGREKLESASAEKEKDTDASSSQATKSEDRFTKEDIQEDKLSEEKKCSSLEDLTVPVEQDSDSGDDEIEPSPPSLRTSQNFSLRPSQTSVLRQSPVKKSQEEDEKLDTETAKLLVPDTELQSSPKHKKPQEESSISETIDLIETVPILQDDSEDKRGVRESKMSLSKTSHTQQMVSERVEDTETQNLPEAQIIASEDMLHETKQKSDSEHESPIAASKMLPPPSSGHKRYFKMGQTPQKRAPGSRISDMVSSNFADVSNAEKHKLGSHVFTNPKHVVGSFSDWESLASVLKSIGVSLTNEKLKTIAASKDASEHEICKTNFVHRVVQKENTVVEEYLILGSEDASHSHSDTSHQFSPISSGSTTTSTKGSSFISTPSGEMGDISSSASSKSVYSSGSSNSNARLEGKAQGTQTTLSQASLNTTNIKTSAQSSGAVSFENLEQFIKNAMMTSSSESKSSQDDFRNPVVVLSPIKTIMRKVDSEVQSASAPSSKTKAKGKRKQPLQRAVVPETSETDIEEKKPIKRAKKQSTSSKSTASPKTQSAKKSPQKRSTTRRKEEDKPESQTKNQSSTETPRLVVAPLIDEDSSSNPAPFGSILPGVRVMARWKDGFYYPGIVQSEDSEGRWSVQFDDGAIRIVPQESLLKIALLQVGTSVLALSPDSFYDPGVVDSHYREGNDIGYVIAHESGVTKRYSRGSVILSTEQAKLITDTRPMPPPSLTINLDNIVGGKRKRKSSQPMEAETTPPPPKTARGSRRRKAADSNLETTESSANEELPREKTVISKVKRELSKTVSDSDEVPDEDVSLADTHQKQTKGKKGKVKKSPKKPTTKTVKKKSQSASESNAVSKKLGTTSDSDAAIKESANKKSVEKSITSVVEQPPVGTNKLFQGCGFLLSYAFRKITENDIASDDESRSENAHPFDKETLCRQIISGGGVVFETFEEAQKSSKKKIFLLANTCLRTIKYIQCVAANIPCISHNWVQLCLLTGQFLCHIQHLLPSGLSIIKNQIVSWHGKTDIFKNLKIVVTSEKKSDFVNIWTPVLLAAKADLVQKWTLPSFAVPGQAFFVDVIVTNATCPKDVLAAAKRRKIPVISSEWVIQCIIAGEKLPYGSHAKFKHDYRE